MNPDTSDIVALTPTPGNVERQAVQAKGWERFSNIEEIDLAPTATTARSGANWPFHEGFFDGQR
jgi:hypothetical protein